MPDTGHEQHENVDTVDLAAWYRKHGRHHIPWRDGTSRWQVLVGEVMATQTQIERATTHWARFTATYPTPEACAAAGQDEILAAWGRLGYPRRARDLHRSAIKITNEGWPEQLTDLPGVGPWIAAAVEAQSTHSTAFALDVNIRRVAERWLGRRGSDNALATIRDAFDALDGKHQLLAAIDLGALICTRREPACNRCPIAARCATKGVLENEHGARRQAPYHQSDRKLRGDLLQTLRETGETTASAWPDRIVASLQAEELIDTDGQTITLHTGKVQHERQVRR